MSWVVRGLTACLLLTGCGEADPEGTTDAAPLADAFATVDAPPQPDAMVVECPAIATDYTPRDNASADDTWPACISDDNSYHRFDNSISSIARVAGFEAVAELLFTGAAPSSQAFADAQLIYVEDGGLESRLVRREDEHYAPAPAACNDTVNLDPADYPDRCAGPVQIQPVVEQAFTAGYNGDQPRVQAARIEAGLLWFLYLSVYKEATTCMVKVNDCDSSYAYYGGGQERTGGLGLARYVRTRVPTTHDRVWDGLLAVRCWRDLDNPTGEAADEAMRDRARAQLDRALLHGLAAIIRDRVVALSMATGDDAEVAWAFLQVLGPVLNREAGERDAVAAEVLAGQWSKADPTTVETGALLTAIDALFPCP